MRHPKPKTVYFAIEGCNSFAVVFYVYYLFFLLHSRYGFDGRSNLLAAALHGLTYFGVAWLGGRFGQRYGYLTALRFGFGGMALVLLFGSALAYVWAQMLVLASWTAAMSFTWPGLEATIVQRCFKSNYIVHSFQYFSHGKWALSRTSCPRKILALPRKEEKQNGWQGSENGNSLYRVLPAGLPNMRIESIQVERERLSEMVKGLPRGPVVIMKKGRPCAALVSVEDGDLEPVLIAQDRGSWRSSMVARAAWRPVSRRYRGANPCRPRCRVERLVRHLFPAWTSARAAAPGDRPKRISDNI